MRARPMRGWAALLLAAGLALGCDKDPHDAQTWIDKLDDPREVDEAVRNLERLHDPKSVKSLGELWKKMNRPSKVLSVIINVAGRVHTKDDPNGEHHHVWTDAVPYLTEAVESFEVTDERSIADATLACEALGKAADPSTLQVLIGAAQKSTTSNSPANRVRIAAVRALGKFKDPRAVDVLIKILGADPEKQTIRLHAAAALALAETGTPKALPALKQALFIGPISSQVRRALSRVGNQAIEPMLAVFQEKDGDINKLAKEQNWAKKAPGTMPYMSALVLGDLRARNAVSLLTDALKGESKVSYFNPKTGEPGPPTHMAVLEALHYIGDPAAAGALVAYATDPKTDDQVRPRAIEVASWVSTDGSLLPSLLKYIDDSDGEMDLRFSSIMAYGRLGRTSEDARELDSRIASYDEKIKAAGKEKKPELEVFRDALKEARTSVEAAQKCKKDAACYATLVDAKDAVMGQPGLSRALRALAELYRMGDKGRVAVDVLLKHADTPDRLLRQGIHLALPRIAPTPCKQCADRLDQVLTSQASQTTLDALNADTRIVYHYFLTH